MEWDGRAAIGEQELRFEGCGVWGGFDGVGFFADGLGEFVKRECAGVGGLLCSEAGGGKEREEGGKYGLRGIRHEDSPGPCSGYQGWARPVRILSGQSWTDRVEVLFRGFEALAIGGVWLERFAGGHIGEDGEIGLDLGPELGRLVADDVGRRIGEVTLDVCFDAGRDGLGEVLGELMEECRVSFVGEGIAAEFDDVAGVEVAVEEGMLWIAELAEEGRQRGGVRDG